MVGYQNLVAASPTPSQAIDTAIPSNVWSDGQSIMKWESEKATKVQYRDDLQLVTAPVGTGSGPNLTMPGLQMVPGSLEVFGNNGSATYLSSVTSSTNYGLVRLVQSLDNSQRSNHRYGPSPRRRRLHHSRAGRFQPRWQSDRCRFLFHDVRLDQYFRLRIFHGIERSAVAGNWRCQRRPRFQQRRFAGDGELFDDGPRHHVGRARTGVVAAVRLNDACVCLEACPPPIARLSGQFTAPPIPSST